MLFAAGKTIHIGDHITHKLFGLTLNVDTVISTLVAAVIFLVLGFWMRHKVTSGVPGKLQLMYEFVVQDLVGTLAESSIGSQYKKYVPIGVTFFIFILICNWMSLLPTALQPGNSYDLLPPPTSDINLPLAMALFAICWVHIESFRARGIRGYFRHYRQPFFALAPINVIEELIKPITMTLRLFGNLFAGLLMLSVITTLLPIYVVPFGELLWKPFDLFIGAIQAYIFMLLTILYFGMATSHDETHQQRDGLLVPVEALETSH